MSTSSISLPASRPARAKTRALAIPAPELGALLVLAGVLYLWALDRNGFANEYYSAAVRSMSTSWHAFLYGSFDASGVMTVDKPPLALWVQALSARVFGFSSWSLLVPQALMGVATVALVYDLTRRNFGRVAGFTAGLALVLTPIAVAVSRHNNPDALLVLCCTAARVVRRPRVRGRPHALDRPRRRRRRPRLRGQDGGGAARRARDRRRLAVDRSARPRHAPSASSLAGGAAMTVVGLAWPMLMWLTPAADRPWISGHERQQHLVADPRLQRPRPPVRAERRARRERRRRAGRRRLRRRRPVRRRPRPAAPAQPGARRPGRLAARRRGRRRPRPARRHAAAPQRPAHRLAAARRRRVPDDRRRVQPRRGHLPPLLRLPARAVHRRAGRRDGGAGARPRHGGADRRRRRP